MYVCMDNAISLVRANFTDRDAPNVDSRLVFIFKCIDEFYLGGQTEMLGGPSLAGEKWTTCSRITDAEDYLVPAQPSKRGVMSAARLYVSTISLSTSQMP